ncbi:DUF2955 domain-containing protein [Aliiruegeria sabulilitoris]|uniref:DUF2955 domain-containing protein n=1 Tax=Aliiruegeria sabulilitoris TaxID=1510458 RepID=UPI0009E788D3|nr:DUF2955 domain-containing protein [Aliiruegeria sabulilitoris]NDR55889.1 DUF2955 domain-containing protein [Pseudoruegeria sp. M32A2M]
MPTDARRSILRLTFGTVGVFGLGLLLDWPLSFLGAVFAALFLQAPAAMPIKVAAKLFLFAILLMLASWIVFSLLAPYPLVFLGAVAIAIVLSFTWSLSGAGILPGVLALMAAMMIPNIIVQSKELALVLVAWIPGNLLIAGFASALSFTLFPAAPNVAGGGQERAAADFDPVRRLVRMSMVTVPFAMAFFLFGLSALLVLFFVALLSQQLAAIPAAGKKVAIGMLTANLLGAGIAIVFYEINVIAPSVVTSILLTTILCVVLGTLSKSDHQLAPMAGSALTTVIIVYGGSIAPFSDEADVKSIVRVVQIGISAMIVIVAYTVVDEFLPERSSAAQSS